MNTHTYAVVGCGRIAQRYADTLKPYKQLKLAGAYDVMPERTAEFCAKNGGKAYSSLDELLADPTIEIILNLTIHQAHVEVIRKSLLAGKHIHTEKPIALTYPEAAELVQLAEEKGLRFGSSPIVFLGEAHQTAFKFIRSGKLGKIPVVFAEVNWGRIEQWHPNPVPFYQVGVLFDVAVYPLTVLTALFGPVRRVHAHGSVLLPHRKTIAGKTYHLDVPDYTLAHIEFVDGTLLRLTADFFVNEKNTNQKAGIEFHGELGSLILSNWISFDSEVKFGLFEQEMQPVPYLKEPYKGCEWAQSLVEMADAIDNNRPHRAQGAHAAHVIEIINAIQTSMRNDGAPVQLFSLFTPPEPMDWAK